MDHSEKLTIDLNVKNKHKMTAFMCAITRACLDGHKDVFQLLLENSNPRIDLNVSDSWLWTESFLASKRGHQKIFQWITEKLKTVNNDNQAAEVPNPKEVKAKESIAVNVNQPKKPRLDAEAPP